MSAFAEWLRRTVDDSGTILLAVLAGLVIVWQRSDNKAIAARILTLIASGGGALAVGNEVAAWAGTPIGLTHIALTVLGPLALETAALMIADPARLLEYWKLWRGK